MDISEWAIEIRYKIPAGTLMPDRVNTATETTEMVIDGVLTSPSIGKFSIYPHARVRYNADGTTTDVLVPSDYITPELRLKLVTKYLAENVDSTPEEANAAVAPINQVWDDDEVGPSVEYPFYIVRIKKFDHNGCEKCYQEEQVHNVGFVRIASRWLTN